jgi:hypothetical protein
MGALLSVAVDGSPVAIIHLVSWIALYALMFALKTRTPAPLIVLSGALAAMGLLDAGYLWPMLDAQNDFPRLTKDRFTSVMTLLWFAVIPMRGKLLPANGLGYELSVYIGPLLAWEIWRHRDWCREHMPADMKVPLVAVSIVSVVMGMGSLASVHFPIWLSPFDLLRPLPGFRSLWITGRYWGFLALPLSLLGAAALWRLAGERRSNVHITLWMAALLLLQLGFQAQTIFSQWLGTAIYHPIPWQDHFHSGPQTVTYVATPRHGVQGQFITPIRGVVNCYDLDDFLHADISAGTPLLRARLADGHSNGGASAAFVNWSRIEFHAGSAAEPAWAPRRVKWVLNQAYHKHWHMPGCNVQSSARGNIIVDCPVAVAHHPSALTFFDPLSGLATRVSLIGWSVWWSLMTVAFSTYWALRRLFRRTDCLPEEGLAEKC